MSIRNIALIVILAAVAVGGYVLFFQNSADDTAMSGPEMMTINFGNNSYDPLASVEMSLAGQESYSAVALAEGGLGAGDFVDVTVPKDSANCTYDLRVTKVNGDVSMRPGVDLCAATFYHFADDG